MKSIHEMIFLGIALWLLEKVSRGWSAKDEAIPKIQIGQRQVPEYQEGGIPFGLGYGLAPTVTSPKSRFGE